MPTTTKQLTNNEQVKDGEGSIWITKRRSSSVPKDLRASSKHVDDTLSCFLHNLSECYKLNELGYPKKDAMWIVIEQYKCSPKKMPKEYKC